MVGGRYVPVPLWVSSISLLNVPPDGSKGLLPTSEKVQSNAGLFDSVRNVEI